MAFSDLCHISNAFKNVENEPDQSERIMEENSMVRDLITKILDETGPTEGSSSLQSQEKTVSGLSTNGAQYPKTDTGHTSYIPPSSFNPYQEPTLYNYNQNDQNNFSFNLQNGFGNTNGYVNYMDNDVGSLMNLDPITDASADTVTPEQLNLLRLAAQEIGGAQFTSPNNEKFYNFFEPSQRNSLPENNMFSATTANFNRPNSLSLDMNYNTNFEGNTHNARRYTNKYDGNFMKDQNQESTELLAYLNQLNMSIDRPRDDNNLIQNNMDFKMPLEMNGHYQNEDFKLQDERNKMFYSRSFQQVPPKSYPNGENGFFLNEMMKQMNDRSPINQNFEYSQTPPTTNSLNYKPNGFQSQNDFMQRRDMNPMMARDNFPTNGLNDQRANYDHSLGRDGGMQQAAMMRQNQELARQMSLLMRNRPPPNQLNVDVSFLHENTPFNLGLGALLGPSPPVQPPVMPSPMLDLPLLAPFYAMRNMRGAATSSGVLHARLDACYEQWRQLERERKRTEARLALAYPGRAVSSSNSIPVPRLPPCPTRVDRLTVDMLREHTKVLTLMGKMETLRASVCVAQNKRPVRLAGEDARITVLRRGQDNVAGDPLRDRDRDSGVDPDTFDPTSWKEDVKNLAEIAPHSEVESAMLAWRNAVTGVQAARRRELAPHAQQPRGARHRHDADPILQLADAVKQLGVCARRARCAMWCDLTLTVALAPRCDPPPPAPAPAPAPAAPAPATTSASATTASTSATASAPPAAAVNAGSGNTKIAASEKLQQSLTVPSASSPKRAQENQSGAASSATAATKQATNDGKEEKTPPVPSSTTKNETKTETNNNTNTNTNNNNNNNNKTTATNKQTEKQQDKSQQRRTQNYRHKLNQGRNDYYPKNQRYDNRFMHNRHPYHYLATGPIN